MKIAIPQLDKNTRRRWRRGLSQRRKGAIELGQQADANIDKLLIRRFDRLASVRRFVLLWVGLFVVLVLAGIGQLRGLSAYYHVLRPVPGGLYNEGMIGTFTTANPLYATGTADAAVSRLVFSGLFKYDNNNNLVGDLAKDWTLSDNQTRYVVHLKKGIKWQDGKPFTADDVIFTYHTIQNSETQSPLYSSWKDITVTKQDAYTVNFDLPNPLSPFPYALTNGIIPAHLLKSIPPEQLRSAAFDTAPIGTGPFELKYIDVSGNTANDRQQRIALQAYDQYWVGRPKLDGFSLTTFSDDQHLISAFEHKQLNAMSGLETLPPELANDSSVQTYSTPLTSAVMAFFNNSMANLNDVNIRRALTISVDRSQLENLFGSPIKLVTGPLLTGQLGYDSSITEPNYNLTAANQSLDQDGWLRGAGGIRYKDGQPLSFTMSSQDTPQYSRVAQFLQQQWAKIGVKVVVHYYDAEDLQSIVIANHSYDILLYGINIGVDPDVFAYWDSSQASVSSQGHLNLSEYKSAVTDQALEAGRTRSDPSIRVLKYKAFLTAWTGDMPALALYQPDLLYITRGPVFNYQRKADNSELDQFYNVNQWEVRQQEQNI
ncbi:MAG: peptide ABC transporter substrate-binding protein [Candidatus Saccharimonadales bacterium]